MNVSYLVSRVENHIQTIDPNKEAVKLESEATWTYGKLSEMTNRYANSLENLGVEKGDRVGILLYNSIEYIALYFAVAKIGAIAVRLNFRLAKEELIYVLNDSDSKVLCFDEKLSETVESVSDSVGVSEYICTGDAPKWARPWDYLSLSSSIYHETRNIDKTDPVMLMYTSGTTGRPKGALWTHENTMWFASMQCLKWNFNSNTVGMTTGPLYHVGAFEDIAIATLLSGGTMVITKSGGFDIERVLNVIENNHVTDCFMFPFMIYEMLKSPNISSYKLEDLNNIYTGGDPLTSWAIDELHETFPEVGLIQVFGLTEGTPIAAALDPSDSLTKGYTAGKPMPFTQVKIVDDENNKVGFNAIGEICVKGPAVVEKYWRKPEESKKTFIDGWCHTGDLGFLDNEGYLTISGRKKDMIRSGGENVYPVEVENVLIRHESVQDVAVIGIPDPKYIEAVCAIIVLKPGEQLKEEELYEFLKRKLAGYKKPRQIEFVEELPRTPSGKVQKFRLRERYTQK